MHRPPMMLSGFRHHSYESRFRACCNSRRIAVSRRRRRPKMPDARRSARRSRVSATVIPQRHRPRSRRSPGVRQATENIPPRTQYALSCTSPRVTAVLSGVLWPKGGSRSLLAVISIGDYSSITIVALQHNSQQALWCVNVLT